MYITLYECKNFKSISNCNLCFNKGLTVITGKNGVGKTNIIDSIKFVINEDNISKNNLLTQGTEECSIKIAFSDDNSEIDKYTILKKINNKNEIKTFCDNKVPIEKLNCILLDADSHSNLDKEKLKQFAIELKEKSKTNQIIIVTMAQEIINISDCVITLDTVNNLTVIQNISEKERSNFEKQPDCNR